MEFSEYVAARRPSLVRATVLMGCPQPDAEDVVQSALLRCFRSWRRVVGADQPEAYVYRVLVNTLNDARSRRWNGELPTETLPEAPTEEADPTTGMGVRRALAAMTPEHRQVLVLRYYADLSERETADALRLPAGTVKSRTARALAALAAHDDVRSL